MTDTTQQRTAKRATWRDRARLIVAVVEGVIVLAALVVIAACLAFLRILIFDPERGSELTSGLRPVQFYQDFDAELLDDYSQVYAIAHNSGNSVESTLEALAFDANIIEVDVVPLNGRLYAAHAAPVPWFGGVVFRGPPLERIWIAAAGADAIKLDLKSSTPEFLELVFDFLAQRRGQRQVIVVSAEPNVLRVFAEREPDVWRFFSIATGSRFRVLEEDPSLAEVIDGVSIQHGLLDEERAAWLEEHNLLIAAWTVNDIERVNELVQLGVDAITTDNLAILRLLGPTRRERQPLERLWRPAAEATPVSAATAEPGDRAQIQYRQP
ncbi:MAG TPA: glycerophosphodiester phosphodiesterase [Thermomicrobiales bacterium]